jgi:hypothetical protein
MTFDVYTKSIFQNYLTEAAFPPKPKVNEIYVDPSNKKRYIYRGGSWRLWPQGSKMPEETGGIPVEQQTSAGYGPADVPAKTKLETPEDQPKIVTDIPQLVKMSQAADIAMGTPGIESPKEAAGRYAVQMMSGPNYKQGFDPYQQTAWVNVRKKAEEAMAALEAGSAAKGLIGMVSPEIATALEPLFKKFGNTMLAGAKQIVRKNLAKMYLGMADDFEDKNNESASALWSGIQELQPELTKLKGATSKGRFGDFGKRVYDEISNLSAAGEDPLEAALKVTGADKAADVLTKQFATGPASVETMGGYLTTGRKSGIYK